MPPHADLLALMQDVPVPADLYHVVSVNFAVFDSARFRTGLGMLTPFEFLADLWRPPPATPEPDVASTPPPFATARAFEEESEMPLPPWTTAA